MATSPTRPPITVETLVRGSRRAAAAEGPPDPLVADAPRPGVTIVLPIREYASTREYVFTTRERDALHNGTMLRDETVDKIGQLLMSLHCSEREAGVTWLMPSATVGMILGGYSADRSGVGGGVRPATDARWASDPSEAFHSSICRNTASTSPFKMETVFLPIVTGQHWILAVLCGLPGLLKDLHLEAAKTEVVTGRRRLDAAAVKRGRLHRCQLLMFDSAVGFCNHEHEAASVRAWLLEEFRWRHTEVPPNRPLLARFLGGVVLWTLVHTGPQATGSLTCGAFVLEALHTWLVTSAGKRAALLGKVWHSHKGDGRDWVLGEDAGPRFLKWMTTFLDASTSLPVDGSVVVV